jgi:RNA polymerase sigma factor (sigma-70 family)
LLTAENKQLIFFIAFRTVNFHSDQPENKRPATRINMMEPAVKELRLAGSGDVGLDREQVEALWSEHAAGIRRFLLGVLRDAHEADEALQQAFVKALEQGHTADPKRRKGWLYKVAFNEAMLRKRRQKTAANAQGRLIDAVRAKTESLGPAQQATHNEQVAQARAAIEQLPQSQQQVVHMRLTESKTFAEIAEALNIPLGTALTRMRLAMKRLKQELQSRSL